MPEGIRISSEVSAVPLTRLYFPVAVLMEKVRGAGAMSRLCYQGAWVVVSIPGGANNVEKGLRRYESVGG